MIQIEKLNPPNYLNSSAVVLAIEKMQDFFTSKNRGQKRYDWPFNKEIDSELKKHLHVVFHGKCGYCETKIGSPDFGNIDRYRPNNGVRDKKEYYQDLYWWLTLEWDNLIYCCKQCNQYKGNYFPINGKRISSPKDDINKENRLLIHPYYDDPYDHFIIDDDNNSYAFTAISDEGLQTIELLRLNRTDLLDGRKKAKIQILNAIISTLNKSSTESENVNQYLSSIYNLDDLSIEFLFYKRWILLNSLNDDLDLINKLNLKDNNAADLIFQNNKIKYKDKLKNNLTKSDYFPIEYIHIKNFKSIENLKINFKEDGLSNKSWLFLLGENGVGKSSILQAIAIGLKLDKKLVNEDTINLLIKKGQQSSEIIIKERNSENIINTKLIRKSSKIEQSGEFNSYLIGYGSLRLSKDETESSSKLDIAKISYENLFKPTLALNDITKWLKSIHTKNIAFFDSIAYSIKQLLPLEKSDKDLSIKNGEIELGNSNTLFRDLSDGYKSTITLAIDIMMKLSDVHSDMDKMSGIVLIDELGNQLHPRWQMSIVKQLRTVFPNINFIISTHHPLCLRGAERDEILMLKNLDNQVLSYTELPDPASLRVDQILASEFFGLNSLVDPEIEAKFNRYYELLVMNDEVTSSERSEIDQLKKFLKNKKHLGDSLREELMYTVIDKLLAEKVIFNKNTVDRNSLKEEAVERVKEVWKNLNLDAND